MNITRIEDFSFFFKNEFFLSFFPFFFVKFYWYAIFVDPVKSREILSIRENEIKINKISSNIDRVEIKNAARKLIGTNQIYIIERFSD